MSQVQVLVNVLDAKTRCLLFPTSVNSPGITIEQVKTRIEQLEGISVQDQRLIQNSKELSNSCRIHSSDHVQLRLALRILGGKGGFGALLRGAGAKAGSKKNTNFDDCRDLSGRRIKDVRAEKEVLEWYAAQKEKRDTPETEEKIEPKEPAFTFNSSGYINQLKETQDNISLSVEQGIKESMKFKEIKAKQEAERSTQPKKKRRTVWSTMDELEESDEEKEVKKEEIIIVVQEKTESTKETPQEAQQTTESLPKEVIDLNKYNSAEELETLGLDKLKTELQRLGVLCGGTLKDRATRLFCTKGKKLSELDPKLLAKKENPNKRKK